VEAPSIPVEVDAIIGQLLWVLRQSWQWLTRLQSCGGQREDGLGGDLKPNADRVNVVLSRRGGVNVINLTWRGQCWFAKSSMLRSLHYCWADRHGDVAARQTWQLRQMDQVLMGCACVGSAWGVMTHGDHICALSW
jgi:hypothetical protein